jgi:hypothetical protein
MKITFGGEREEEVKRLQFALMAAILLAVTAIIVSFCLWPLYSFAVLFCGYWAFIYGLGGWIILRGLWGFCGDWAKNLLKPKKVRL